MVKVFFESNSHAEQVAVFEEEDLYMACLPALEEQAEKDRMVVTESIDGDTFPNNGEKHFLISINTEAGSVGVLSRINFNTDPREKLEAMLKEHLDGTVTLPTELPNIYKSSKTFDFTIGVEQEEMEGSSYTLTVSIERIWIY